MSRRQPARWRWLGVFLAPWLVLGWPCSNATATLPSAPVRVEYARPAPLKQGEEATTVITFRALADVDRLEVSVARHKGLEVVSRPTSAVFSEVKKGEGRELAVTVRLTDSKEGLLAIFFKTQRGSRREAGVSGIAFGNDGSQ